FARPYYGYGGYYGGYYNGDYAPPAYYGDAAPSYYSYYAPQPGYYDYYYTPPPARGCSRRRDCPLSTRRSGTPTSRRHRGPAPPPAEPTPDAGAPRDAGFFAARPESALRHTPRSAMIHKAFFDQNSDKLDLFMPW